MPYQEEIIVITSSSGYPSRSKEVLSVNEFSMAITHLKKLYPATKSSVWLVCMTISTYQFLDEKICRIGFNGQFDGNCKVKVIPLLPSVTMNWQTQKDCIARLPIGKRLVERTKMREVTFLVRRSVSAIRPSWAELNWAKVNQTKQGFMSLG